MLPIVLFSFLRFVVAVSRVSPDGKTKYICTCGQSKNFPYCDGSHRAYNAEHGTSVAPKAVSKESTGKDQVWVCACGLAKGRAEGEPFCDGSHKSLAANQPAAAAAAAVAEAEKPAEAAAEAPAAAAEATEKAAEAEESEAASAEASVATSALSDSEFIHVNKE